jgi:hypothetical protein
MNHDRSAGHSSLALVLRLRGRVEERPWWGARDGTSHRNYVFLRFCLVVRIEKPAVATTAHDFLAASIHHLWLASSITVT